MTFKQMLDSLYADLGFPQPSTEQTTRLKRWCNEGYRHLMSAPNRDQLRNATLTLTTVASQTTYALPQAVSKIYAVTQVANNTRLGMMTLDTYRTVNSGLNQNGNFASFWIPYGWAPVFQQPGGKGLWAVSSSVSDTTQKVNVQGFFANGDMSPEVQSSVLTGTSRVQIGTDTTWNVIERLDIDAVGVGIIRIYDAVTGGNELLRLQPGQTSAQYQYVILFPTPASAVPYSFDVSLQLTELVNDNDIPLLPIDFHDMIPLYARLREEKRAGADPRLPWDDAEMKARVSALSRTIDWPNDYNPAVGGWIAGYGFNRLGANYPAEYVWR